MKIDNLKNTNLEALGFTTIKNKSLQQGYHRNLIGWQVQLFSVSISDEYEDKLFLLFYLITCTDTRDIRTKVYNTKKNKGEPNRNIDLI